MSANFYNDLGLMIGVDLHGYSVAGSPLKAPCPHFVNVIFMWKPALDSKRAHQVTSMGFPTIKGSFDVYAVPHVPIVVPPGAVKFPVEYAQIMTLSGTKAQLTVHTVTGEGDKLACCIKGAVGLNINCFDPVDAWSGGVMQTNTVQTQPTIGDFVGAGVGYMVDASIGAVIGHLLEESEMRFLGEAFVKHVLRRVPELLGPLFGDLGDIPGFIGQKVQEYVDSKLGDHSP